MNREIQDLREVITKLVPLLTGKGLKVTQRGTQAYVQANARTNKPEVVNIPSIPDNASPDFISAVAGFVDHEVAHVLFTDWALYGGDGIRVDKFSPEGRALTITHNIVEDTFIEREIVKTFPGSRRNLERLHKHFVDKITTPAVASVKGDVKKEFEYLIVPMMRALSGQEIFQEFMDVNGHWKNPMIESLHMAMSNEALELIKTATSTSDTLEVAQEIHDILFRQKQEEEEQQQQQQSSNGKSQDKPEKKAGQGDGDGERDHSESEGDDSSDSDDAGKGSSKKDEDGEGADDASGDEAEEDGASVSDEESDASDDADDEGEGAGEDEDDDASDESDSDDEGNASNDGDDADDDAGEGESDDDESDDGGGVNESADPEDDEEYEDIEGGKTAGNDEQSQGGGGAGGEAGKSMFDLDPADFNPVDLSGAISAEIEKMAVASVGASDYSVFTKDEDRIEVLKVDERYMKDGWVSKMDDEVSHLVGPMQKDIERLMAAQSLSVRTSGHRSGRLHSPSLYRVSLGDPRVFQRKEERTSKDTAVMLLCDNSGSMHGSRMATAMKAAYALAQTLERVQIPSEILGFTTGDLSSAARKQLMDEHSKGVYFHRCSTIIMPIYKSFNERVTPQVKQRIAYQLNVQAGMNTNTDGESIEYAAMRLIPRKEKRKVMLVMSDGQPVGSGTGAHLKATVSKLNKMGIETVGIGIESNAVQNFYDRSLVLNDVADLPATVMGELKRILQR